MKKNIFDGMDIRQRMAERDKRGKIRIWIGISIAILIIIICLVFVFNTASDVKGVELKESITVEIAQGSGTSAIATQLEDAGAIKSAKKFKAVAKDTGMDKKFQPGSITIENGMSYEKIMEVLTKPNRGRVKVVIPEGYELRQITDTLEKAGVIDRATFESELVASKYDYPFLKDLPNRENSLEGYLFPDTYFISTEYTEKDIINMMLSEFNKRFKDEYYARAKELNMTVDDIVTLASVIERETSSDPERAKVAGVFYNRLKTNMKLQSCATVQYILKERKANLSIADTQIDSPYNTYKNSGLPVGPIASPGIECIVAALYPEETDAVYFVMGKDGKHVFSKTYDEHLKAKKEAGL